MLKTRIIPCLDVKDGYKEELEAGTLFLHTESGLIQNEQVQIFSEWSVVIQTESLPTRRKLHDEEIRSVIVLRISMADSQVKYSAKEIEEHLFIKKNCMSHQFLNCLNGKLTMTFSGVLEITVPGKTTDYTSPSEIRNTALVIASQQEKVQSAGELADHVMVILPKNDFLFIANAGTNHWISTYNNEWSLDMIVYMHELGMFSPKDTMSPVSILLTGLILPGRFSSQHTILDWVMLF